MISTGKSRGASSPVGPTSSLISGKASVATHSKGRWAVISLSLLASWLFGLAYATAESHAIEASDDPVILQDDPLNADEAGTVQLFVPRLAPNDLLIDKSGIVVQNLGSEPSKVIAVFWSAPHECSPGRGPARPFSVECSGLLATGASWTFAGGQIEPDAQSAALFSVVGRTFRELHISPGTAEGAADYMCRRLAETLTTGEAEYRKFKSAFQDGNTYDGVPMDRIYGGEIEGQVLRVSEGQENSRTGYEAVSMMQAMQSPTARDRYRYLLPGDLPYNHRPGWNAYLQNVGARCATVSFMLRPGARECEDRPDARECAASIGITEGESIEVPPLCRPDAAGVLEILSDVPLGWVVDLQPRKVFHGQPLGAAHESRLNSILNGFDQSEGSDVTSSISGPLETGRELQVPLPGKKLNVAGVTTAVIVTNHDASRPAEVKLTILDGSGDIVSTLVDTACPLGSVLFEWEDPTHLVPLVESYKVESRAVDSGLPPAISASVHYLSPIEAVGLPMIGTQAIDGRAQHHGLIGIPSLIKQRGDRVLGNQVSNSVSIYNAATKPGFTDFVLYIYDQNGMLDFICQKLHRGSTEYIETEVWGYIAPNFRGSALVSAFFWEHGVFDDQGQLIGDELFLIASQTAGWQAAADRTGMGGIGITSRSRVSRGQIDHFPNCASRPAPTFTKTPTPQVTVSTIPHLTNTPSPTSSPIASITPTLGTGTPVTTTPTLTPIAPASSIPPTLVSPTIVPTLMPAMLYLPLVQRNAGPAQEILILILDTSKESARIDPLDPASLSWLDMSRIWGLDALKTLTAGEDMAGLIRIDHQAEVRAAGSDLDSIRAEIHQLRPYADHRIPEAAASPRIDLGLEAAQTLIERLAEEVNLREFSVSVLFISKTEPERRYTLRAEDGALRLRNEGVSLFGVGKTGDQRSLSLALSAREDRIRIFDTVGRSGIDSAIVTWGARGWNPGSALFGPAAARFNSKPLACTAPIQIAPFVVRQTE